MKQYPTYLTTERRLLFLRLYTPFNGFPIVLYTFFFIRMLAEVASLYLAPLFFLPPFMPRGVDGYMYNYLLLLCLYPGVRVLIPPFYPIYPIASHRHLPLLLPLRITYTLHTYLSPLCAVPSCPAPLNSFIPVTCCLPA